MLVVYCWPSSLIMMQVGFQASTRFLSHWVPWGERRGLWYGLIVWACHAGAPLGNSGFHWWCVALHRPAHIAAGRYGSQQWGKARWGAQEWKWPPFPDRIHHSRAGDCLNILKYQSVRLDRRFSSKALILWQMLLFSESSANREL